MNFSTAAKEKCLKIYYFIHSLKNYNKDMIIHLDVSAYKSTIILRLRLQFKQTFLKIQPPPPSKCLDKSKLHFGRSSQIIFKTDSSLSLGLRVFTLFLSRDGSKSIDFTISSPRPLFHMYRLSVGNKCTPLLGLLNTIKSIISTIAQRTLFLFTQLLLFPLHNLYQLLRSFWDSSKNFQKLP